MTTHEHAVVELDEGVAVVTPTYNRLALLKRLYLSLTKQTDRDFTWIVVDDCSDDGTVHWVEKVSQSSPFRIILLSMDRNGGKGAALNCAFSRVSCDWYVVVDSDDVLLQDGISLVQDEFGSIKGSSVVGAVFFCYRNPAGTVIGQPPDGMKRITTRAAMDSKYGKYDGCIAYSRMVVERFEYPVFEGETYVGPTVLQLMMSPPYEILFTPTVVGFAEYQSNGLTQSGRALRLANPLGMMMYSSLNAEKAETRLWRMKYRISYWAYADRVPHNPSGSARKLIVPPRNYIWERAAGKLLNRMWS